MPETIEDYYARVEAAADDTGRLPMNAEMQAWEIFPFESEGLRLKPLDPLTGAEAPRGLGVLGGAILSWGTTRFGHPGSRHTPSLLSSASLSPSVSRVLPLPTARS